MIIALIYRIKRAIVTISTNIINRLHLSLAGAKVGKGFGSCGTMLIRNYAGKGGITIGKDVFINSARIANPIGGDTKTIIYVDKGAKLLIGNGVKISNTTFFAKCSIEVGERTFIGGGARVYDSDFHSIYPEYRLNGNTHILSAPVVIGKRVFIGSNVQILKGVIIGDDSVVGAGSVVTKSIPAGQIWGGNPAKFIKNIRL